MVRLTDRPDMTLDVYRGRKTTLQPTNQPFPLTVRKFNVGKFHPANRSVDVNSANLSANFQNLLSPSYIILEFKD